MFYLKIKQFLSYNNIGDNMKKIIILLLIIPLLITGCFNKEENPYSKLVWETEGNETGVVIDGKTYALVKIVITNNSKEDVNLYTTKLCIYDSNDKEIACNSIGASDTILSITGYSSKRLDTTVLKEESVKGYVAFETDSEDIKTFRVK